MNKKGFAQVLLSPKIIGLVFLFIVGILIFQWAQPQLIGFGLSASLASFLAIVVLVGIGVWIFIKSPL